MAMALRHLWMLATSLVLLGFGPKDARALRNVSLRVMPPAVQRGEEVSFLCQYDLENELLYSVKWYRGRHEFYRYSPSEHPVTKIFPYPGIHVDLSSSNESLVVLKNVGFTLSGNFSCEVTVDAPSFSTKTVTEQMLVVSLPESAPTIVTNRDRYDPGEVLLANCTSPPSKPAASLSFLLNEVPVGRPDIRQYHAGDSLQSSALSLEMTLLPSHYHNGQLVLKCTAYLSTLYRRTTIVHLWSRASDPVPERVTSPNGGRSAMRPTCALPALLLLVLGCVAVR